MRRLRGPKPELKHTILSNGFWFKLCWVLMVEPGQSNIEKQLWLLLKPLVLKKRKFSLKKPKICVLNYWGFFVLIPVEQINIYLVALAPVQQPKNPKTSSKISGRGLRTKILLSSILKRMKPTPKKSRPFITTS